MGADEKSSCNSEDIDMQDQTKEIELLRQEVQRLKKIVHGLMHGYSTICEANLRTGLFSVLQLSSTVQYKLNEELLWDEMVKFYVSNGVYSDDRDEVAQMLNREYLLNNLPSGGKIKKEFRNKQGIYGESEIVRVDDETIIIGFTEKDMEIGMRKKELYTDSLTHVLNRRYYDECLDRQECAALVIADIDHYKIVNDEYGHLCGDKALEKTASVLQKSIREEDIVVRYGGDEFLIAFSDITEDCLKKRLEDIRKAIMEIRLTDYPTLRLTMSFGAAYGNACAGDMFKLADELLYESKKTRNAVTVRSLT